MLDTLAYTSERVPPITGPRPIQAIATGEGLIVNADLMEQIRADMSSHAFPSDSMAFMTGHRPPVVDPFSTMAAMSSIWSTPIFPSRILGDLV